MSEQTGLVIQKAKVQLPVAYQEEMAAEAAAIAKRLGTPGGDAIKANKDHSFTLPDGTEMPSLDVIVVDFVSANKYYPGKFDAKNIQPPVCYAIGTDIDSMKPSPKSTQIQNKDCKTCPMNQWGSDGRGKACKNERNLAVLAPELQEEGPIYIVKVAPTGTRYFDAHAKAAFALHGGLLNVRTEITQDASLDYASLRFKTIEPNPNPGAAFARRKEARERLMTEPDYGAAEAAKAADKAAKKK